MKMEFMPSSQRRKKLSIFTKKITADIITDYGMQVWSVKLGGCAKLCVLHILQLKVGKKQCNEVRESCPVLYKWSL